MRRLARLWDEAFEIPVLGWRVGLDAIIGLIPGIGDLAGLVAGLYPLAVAARFGAPASLLARMTVNLLTDALLGAVPLLGDLFDIAWKANRRNLTLLERWAAAPGRTERASRLLLGGLGLGIVASVGLIVWLIARLLVALLG